MASTFFDLTAANAALKELYDGQSVENLVYKDNPFLAMIPKKTDFGGKYKPIPIIIGVSQGRSATFANAQTYQAAADVRSFLLTRATDYSIATIDNQTLLASKTDKMTFIEGSKLVVDSAIRTITNSLASGLFRSGTGTIGSGTISGNVVTLSNPADIVQFELNMALQASASDGGASLTGDTTLGFPIAIDRGAGTFTVSTTLGGTAGTPTGWTGTMYFRQAGDRNAKIKGLSAWLPKVAPTGGDSFFGLDRSADPVRLAGVRYDGSAQSIEEALVDASNLVAREGGRPETCITNYASFSALEKALGSKVTYVDAKSPAGIGFRGIKVSGANTQIDVFPDRNCQPQTAYLLQMDTWSLNSLGDAPQILRYGDGMEMLRVYNADAAELRCGYYAQPATNAPGWNGVVTLGA